MEVRLGVGPVPHRDDDVALDTLWSRWRGRHGAGGDAISPVGEHRQRAFHAQLAHGAEHLSAGLARLYAALPRRRGGLEVPQVRRNLARALGAQLMTGQATARLHDPDPLSLVLDIGRNAVSGVPGAWELALLRHPEQGEPVPGGVIRRRRAQIGRRDRGQVQSPSRRARHFRRIHQAITTYPHGVVGFRQIGQHVAPLIVGDHDLDEAGGQIGRFRDNPDARFRTV